MNTKVEIDSRNFSRRKFISTCAACAAYGVCMAKSPIEVSSSHSYTNIKNEKLRIRVIYSLHNIVQDRPDWPNIGFDFKPSIEKYNSVFKKEFPSYEFISTLASNQEDAESIIAQDKNEKIDAYIVFQMNCWNRVVQTIAKSKKPVLYVDFKYAGSGGFLVYNSDFLRNKQSNVGFVSSSRVEDLIEGVKCFESSVQNPDHFASATTMARLKSTPSSGQISWKSDKLDVLSMDETKRRLKESKILAFRDQNAHTAEPIMGIPIEFLTFAELNKAWEAANRDEAKVVAEKWKNNSSKIVDVSFDELQNSAAFYLGMKSILKKHQANAITVNCLGGFYGNHIHAYPCLGFHELANEGLIGACECDIRSTVTMVAFSTMTGRPGYISDPVIDTSKRQIIYAHCVAPNKMFGTEGAANPYNIMTHSEDRQGAAVQSMLPLGYLTTTLEIDNDKKEIIFHQAKAVDNDPDDRACRTKLCAEPIGDIEKLFTEWDRWEWHRVTFYGDLKKPVYDLADSIGWRVIEET
ncbi:MAG: hypothetical protein QM237_00955 [Bacteroidota bacterium]|nr:hypothetical protein [Bacteroidota bacterium]